ncbi:MAG: hypothetical protein ACOCNL_14560 [Acetivibrio ethanolgignens]
MGRKKNNDLNGDFFIVAMRSIDAVRDIWGCKVDNGWKEVITQDGGVYLDFFLIGTKIGTIIVNEDALE